ncbi:unnamed protein product [Vitrella brassicaformis CCMP3155]|uniref:EF-hand domain-containing protein n=1 Tax=Vitrella brassicaformis (strain CCMP3155) TaxID=1169540 RepID=A0A0G4F2Q2_VITBC|nr:unnamed protein product [Vitrella brassicaformis CCMP3155]|eukprot:CEM05667.1 unnamed protein product [Vitrella brassicaformis CCMP3155]
MPLFQLRWPFSGQWRRVSGAARVGGGGVDMDEVTASLDGIYRDFVDTYNSRVQGDRQTQPPPLPPPSSPAADHPHTGRKSASHAHGHSHTSASHSSTSASTSSGSNAPKRGGMILDLSALEEGMKSSLANKFNARRVDRPKTGRRSSMHHGHSVHDEESAGKGWAQAYHITRDGQVDLCDLRRKTQLHHLPIEKVLRSVRREIEHGMVYREGFETALQRVADEANLHIDNQHIKELFSVLDQKRNGVVDVLELVCGLAQFCEGDKEQRLRGLFELFDVDGDGHITYDEMVDLLSTIYRVMLTPAVVLDLKKAGVQPQSVIQLSRESATECFSRLSSNHHQQQLTPPDQRPPVPSYPTPIIGIIAQQHQHQQQQQHLSSLQHDPAHDMVTANGEGQGDKDERSISFDDFREWCESTPPRVGFSRSSVLRAPFVRVLNSLLAPPHPHLLDCPVTPPRKKDTNHTDTHSHEESSAERQGVRGVMKG